MLNLDYHSAVSIRCFSVNPPYRPKREVEPLRLVDPLSSSEKKQDMRDDDDALLNNAKKLGAAVLPLTSRVGE
jgi:hypothetical protein